MENGYEETSRVERFLLVLLLLLLLLSHFSCVWLCATPYTAAHQAPPSLGVSRQEHWSGLPFPSPMHESEVAQSSPTLSDPMDCRKSRPWDFPGKSTGVGCHCLLRRFLLNWYNKISAEGRPGSSYITWKMGRGMRNLFSCGGWADIKGKGILTRTLAGFLWKLDCTRQSMEAQDQGLVEKRAQRSLTKFWSKWEFLSLIISFLFPSFR